MKILGFNIKREKRAVTNDGEAIVYSPYTSLGLTFGDMVRQRTAMSLSAVYRCVELISDSVAILPLRVKHGNDVVSNHPLTLVFADKGSIMSQYQFIKRLVADILLSGNGYAYIERTTDGTVKKLRYLQPSDVTVCCDKQKNTLYYQCALVSSKKIEAVNMLHVVKNSRDGVNGISVISAADNSLTLAKSAEASATNWYSRGCNMAGVLTVSSNLNPQQRQDIINSWNTAYSTGGQGIAVLQGNMTYQPIQVSAKDAQLIETRQYNARDIARFFGVSPSMIGDNDGASYNSIEAEQQAFLLHTLQPYITLIESEFTRKLLYNQPEFRVDLDETALLKTDKAATASYYSALTTNGILTRNEARIALGYAPVDGGDTLQVAFSDIAQNTINNESSSNNNE